MICKSFWINSRNTHIVLRLLRVKFRLTAILCELSPQTETPTRLLERVAEPGSMGISQAQIQSATIASISTTSKAEIPSVREPTPITDWTNPVRTIGIP